MIFTLDIELLFRSYQIIAIQDRLPFHLPQDLLVFHRTYLTPNQPWEVSILPSQPDNSPRCFNIVKIIHPVVSGSTVPPRQLSGMHPPPMMVCELSNLSVLELCLVISGTLLLSNCCSMHAFDILPPNLFYLVQLIQCYYACKDSCFNVSVCMLVWIMNI